jgi:hypothetical protein
MCAESSYLARDLAETTPAGWVRSIFESPGPITS